MDLQGSRASGQRRHAEVEVGVVRLERMTALQNPDRGVRGIVVGDVLRRLVGAPSHSSSSIEDSSRHRVCGSRIARSH